MTLSFGVQDEHGGDLISWIAREIAAHAERYAETKGQLARTLGFEDGFIHGNIQFNVDDLERWLIIKSV